MKKMLVALVAIFGLFVGNNPVNAQQSPLNVFYVHNKETKKAKTDKLPNGMSVAEVRDVTTDNLADLKAAVKEKSVKNPVIYIDNGKYDLGSYALFDTTFDGAKIYGIDNNVVINAPETNGFVQRSIMNTNGAQFNNLIFNGKGLNLIASNHGWAALMIKGIGQEFNDITIQNYGEPGKSIADSQNVAIEFDTQKMEVYNGQPNVFNNTIIKDVRTSKIDSKGVITATNTGNFTFNNITIDGYGYQAAAIKLVYTGTTHGAEDLIAKDAKIQINGELNVGSQFDNSIYVSQNRFGNLNVDSKRYEYIDFSNTKSVVKANRLSNDYDASLINKETLIFDSKTNEYIIDENAKVSLQEQVNNLVSYLNIAYNTNTAKYLVDNKFMIKVISNKQSDVKLNVPDLIDYSLVIKSYSDLDTTNTNNSIDFIFADANDEKNVEFDGFVKEEQIVDPGNNGNEGNEVKPSEKPSKPEVSTSESTKDHVKEKNKTKGVTKVSSKNTLPKTGSQLLTYLTIIVSIASITVLVRKKLN